MEENLSSLTGLEKKVSKAGLEKKRNFAITMNIF